LPLFLVVSRGKGMLRDRTYAIMEGMMRNGIETGFILDRQWHWLRGEMERTKRPALLALARIFAEADVSALVQSDGDR
jgi:hypothetical protein